MPRLHRNNAAEWAMVVVLTPISWLMRGWRRVLINRASKEPGGSAAGSSTQAKRRSVMIEGLPPRTMN